MSPRIERTVIAWALTAVAGLLLALTLGLAPAARAVPLMVVLPTLALLIVELVAPRVRWLRAAYSRLDDFDPYGLRGKIGHRSSNSDDAQRAERELRLLFWVGVLLMLSYALGLLTGLPLFVFLYLRWMSEEPWPLAASAAATTCAALYLLIDLLGAPLFEGQVWRWLGL